MLISSREPFPQGPESGIGLGPRGDDTDIVRVDQVEDYGGADNLLSRYANARGITCHVGGP